MIPLGKWIKDFLKGSEEDTYTPAPINEPTRGAEFSRFADLLPYSAWMPEERLFVLEGDAEHKVDAIGFCLEVLPQTGATPDMADLMTTLFTYLPKDASIQVSLFATPLIDRFLNAHVDTRLPPETAQTQKEYEQRELCLSLALRQANHFAKGATDSLISNQPYLLRDYRICLSVTIPAKSYDDERLIADTCALRETFITTLKTYHQFHYEWTPEDLINWCAIVVNPHRTMVKRDAPNLNYDTGRSIKRQIVDPDTVVRVTENGLVFGLPQFGNEVVMRSMSVRNYPRACTLHAMGSLIGDYMQPAIGYSSPFMITLGIVTTDYEETRAKTQMMSARATQKADSPMAKYMPELKDNKADWDIAQRACDEGKGMCKLYHQIAVFAPPKDIARAAQAAQAVWRAREFEICDDTYMQLQGVLGSLPMTLTKTLARDIRLAHRFSTKTVPNAVNMAPMLAEWHGVGKPIVPLWGRRGQAMGIDLFGNTAGNYNGVVCGTSGSGKSVLLNSIALSYLGVGGRVWIIDIGRSFEKLCHSVGGQYIEFKPDADIRLNPFSMVEDIDEDIEMLVPLFEQMISPSEPLDDYRRRQIGLHIQSLWYEKGRFSTVDDLAYSLINNCELGGPNPLAADPEWVEKVRGMSFEERNNVCDPRIRDLGLQLFPFTKDGPYGKYFQGEANVNFENDFIVLELEELSSKKDLQAVVMFLLMYRITQNMYLSRDKPKVCIVDEAWQLLGSGGSGDFIESGYRRARKYNGSFLAATQSIADFAMSRSAEAAINNADWMFLLRQKPESILALEKTDKLVLDKHMKEMLLSVKTQAGQYSEVFVHGGQMGYGIGRVLFDPFSLLLVSSKAEDFEAVRLYREMGFNIKDALEEVLADRGTPGFTKKLQKVA